MDTFLSLTSDSLNSVAAWSKDWVCNRWLVWLWVRIPPETCMSVSCKFCVLSGRSLCVGLITPLEESYRLWCTYLPERDHKTSIMRKPWSTRGLCAMKRERERERGTHSERRFQSYRTRRHLYLCTNDISLSVASSSSIKMLSVQTRVLVRLNA
jgi:hypothetical protein